MAKIPLQKGTRFYYNQATLIIRECTGTHHFLIENLQFSGRQTVTRQWLEENYADNKLIFERPPLQTKARRERTEQPEDRYPDYTIVPEGPLRMETERRHGLVLLIESWSPEQRNRKGFEALSNKLKELQAPQPEGAKRSRTLGHAISAFSLERWWKDYEASGGDIRVLIPEIRGRGGKGKKRVHPQEALWILQRVEIDHTKLPIMIVDEQDRLPIGSPTLTAAIDAASGLIVGIYVGFEPPSYLAAQNCLLHTILPKKDVREMYGTQHQWIAYGLPDLLVSDKGRDFIGKSLTDACAQLGIAHIILPGRSPWLKGRIERFFRTQIKKLNAQLPGSVSKVTSLFDETYDPKKHACISLSAFYKILHLYLLDECAQKWHKGVQAVPYLRWMEDVAAGHGPELPYSAKEVRALLRSSAEPRVIGRKGIEFEMLYYNSPELAALRAVIEKRASRKVISTDPDSAGTSTSVTIEAPERKVHVKYDPSDMRAIYVWSPIHDGGTWLRVPAVDQVYTEGLTFWKHSVIRRYLRKREKALDSASLRAAKRAIQKVVDEEFHLSRQSRRGRAQAARYNRKGIHPAPSTGVIESPTSLPAAANAGSLASDVLGMPQFVAIGSPSTNTPAPGSTARKGKGKQQSAATVAKKPEPAPKQSEATGQSAPTKDPPQWDMSGWGADCGMPQPLTIQR
jgi:transposase InsO family protein